MNGVITLGALCQCQRASKVVSAFIIFAAFDVSFRSYNLWINFGFFTFIFALLLLRLVYTISTAAGRYTITFEQAMALRLGLGEVREKRVSRGSNSDTIPIPRNWAERPSSNFFRTYHISPHRMTKRNQILNNQTRWEEIFSELTTHASGWIGIFVMRDLFAVANIHVYLFTAKLDQRIRWCAKRHTDV